MGCRCNLGSVLTPVLAVAALVAAGAGGYRLLGGCCGSDKQTEVNAALVSTTTDGECALCPSHGKGECTAHEVAATTEKADGCCAAKIEKVAAEKTDGCCASKAEKVAAEKSGCCSEKDGAAVKTVAGEKKEECAEGSPECAGSPGGCCKEGEKKEKTGTN